jgi:molybdate transport system ATP-binding protein
MTLSLAVAGRGGSVELDVRLAIPPGVLALAGRNGAGKTSLLRMALGLLRPRAGSVRIGERALFDAAARIDVPPEARRLGYVPQHLGLFPHLSVRENVRFGTADAQAAETALRSLDLLGLAERRPGTLSGGERQRVALARALAPAPDALLLDEPLAALDQTARRQVRELLRTRHAALPIPVLVVTHDPADAFALATRVAVLEGGRIVQEGTAAELRRAPATPFVADFVEGWAPG